MHLNEKGKNNVANIVVKILQQKPIEKNDILGTQRFTETYSKGTINIVDANLLSIMQQIRSDHSVPFAHAISSDFDHQKHMTANVTVLYKNEFGRPHSLDYVNENLTRQKLFDGATVYSLVTKSNYSGNLGFNLKAFAYCL